MDAKDSMAAAGAWKRALGEFFYEFVLHALEMRGSMYKLLLVAVFGDMVGVPILPSYYALRLLPSVAPELGAWKRSLLRERELGSDHEHHLHGM
jgi:hypothetical protein